MITDLKQVAAYLGDVIVLDSGPIEHIQTIRSLFFACESTTLSFPPRRLDRVPQMQTSWVTLLPRRVYARTQKKCPHWSTCRCSRMRSSFVH